MKAFHRWLQVETIKSLTRTDCFSIMHKLFKRFMHIFIYQKNRHKNKRNPSEEGTQQHATIQEQFCDFS